jgi:hypothetical protein
MFESEELICGQMIHVQSYKIDNHALSEYQEPANREEI